jgi:hypothetical protein
MLKLPRRKHIEKAIQSCLWDFGNNILYNMCRNNFTHNHPDKTITKMLFIGRIYAAAVERRKENKNLINDTFYIDTVEPAIRKSHLDSLLKELSNIKVVTVNDIKPILETHYHLTKTLNAITGLDKRSLSSKYLHFHLPNHFFIYDSRVVSAVRSYVHRVPKEYKYIFDLKNIDMEYAKYYCKCFELKRQIKEKYKLSLTNRQLDNVLINDSNKKTQNGK